MASKRDPQKQAELDAARERILQERAEREAAYATPRGIVAEVTRAAIDRAARASDVVPVAHDAPSYDVFEAAPLRREVGKPEADWRMSFIDRAAIGLYVAGYPQTKIYDHAARLWELRAQWRKGQGL